MESIGNYLKEKRESLNLSIDEIANETRLKTYIIKQIESDDFAAIKDVGFIKIMVITYCRAVEADEDLVQKKLNQIFDAPPEPPIKINTVKNKKTIMLPKNITWFTSLGVLVVALTCAFYYLYKQESFSFNAIREQLAAMERKQVVPQPVIEVEPDSLWAYQRSIFDSIDVSLYETGVVAVNEEINTRTIREANPKRYLADSNDYVGQLIFNNKYGPLNPELEIWN